MTELGNRLKEAREQLGMSLDELQEITKIQKRYLQGIEEGNYEMMPGPFYARAFIKQYAEAVKLDPEQLFEEYKDEIPSNEPEALPENLSRVQSRKSISKNGSKFLDILPRILVFVLIIGTLFLVWFFYSKNAKDPQEVIENNQHETSYEQAEELTIPDTEESEEEGVEESALDEDQEEGLADEQEDEILSQVVEVVEASGRKTVYEVKNTDQFELKIVSTGETWIDIQDSNGKSLFQGMLVQNGEKEDHTIDVSGEEEVKIVVGNSVNTEIYVNDEKVEFEISPQEQVRQDITFIYNPNNEDE